MTPREFLEQVVRPNIEELRTNHASVRHAHNAVAMVDALAAHVCVWCAHNSPSEVVGLPIENRDSHYRGRLASRNPDFRLLRDVANAQKHVHLTNTKHRKPEVTAVEQITVSSSDWGKYPWGEFPWDGSPQVGVTTASGEERSVGAVALAALEFLEGEMSRLKI